MMPVQVDQYCILEKKENFEKSIRMKGQGFSHSWSKLDLAKTIKLLSLDDTNLASPSKILKLREQGPVYP